MDYSDRRPGRQRFPLQLIGQDHQLVTCLQTAIGYTLIHLPQPGTASSGKGPYAGERNDLQDGAGHEAYADEQDQARHTGPLGEQVAEESESGDPAEDNEQR